jgi:hypothetical protein
MTTIKHNLTGTIYRVDKVAPKTIYMTVIDNNGNKSMNVGLKQKTTPNAIGVLYTVIS